MNMSNNGYQSKSEHVKEKDKITKKNANSINVKRQSMYSQNQMRKHSFHLFEENQVLIIYSYLGEKSIINLIR